MHCDGGCGTTWSNDGAEDYPGGPMITGQRATWSGAVDGIPSGDIHLCRPCAVTAFRHLRIRGESAVIAATLAAGRRNPQPDYTAQDGLPESVWFAPRTSQFEAQLTIRVTGAPKRYVAVWLDTATAGRTGVLREDAIRIWPENNGLPEWCPTCESSSAPFSMNGQMCTDPWHNAANAFR